MGKGLLRRNGKKIVVLGIYYGSLSIVLITAFTAYNSFSSVPTMEELIFPPNNMITVGSSLFPLPYFHVIKPSHRQMSPPMVALRRLNDAEFFVRDYVYDKPVIPLILLIIPAPIVMGTYHWTRKKKL